MAEPNVLILDCINYDDSVEKSFIFQRFFIERRASLIMLLHSFNTVSTFVTVKHQALLDWDFCWLKRFSDSKIRVPGNGCETFFECFRTKLNKFSKTNNILQNILN